MNKNQAETTHQNWPKRPRAESTQAETTQAETTHGRNDSRPKRLTAETTRYPKILLNRLNAHLDQTGLIPESQCGFRKDRGTIDMIFTARQLQEKCQEQNVDLYMTFVDLTKAFDTVSRDGLWKIVAKFGCPPRFIAMVRQFHDGMQARVQNDGEFCHTRKDGRSLLWLVCNGLMPVSRSLCERTRLADFGELSSS